MLYEVRVLSPEGKLKERIPQGTLKKDFWKKFKVASGKRHLPPSTAKKPWEVEGEGV